MRKVLFFAGLITAMLGLTSASVAEEYPSKAVKLVVPYAAGGATDGVFRYFSERLREKLGQPVVIENVDGAGGILGTSQVARAKADGYTLVAQTNQIAFNKLFMPTIPYDLFADFEPVAFLTEAPLVIAVNGSLAIKTVPELVEYAKKKDGGVRLATPGNGTAQHLAGELLAKAGGFPVTPVHYRGSAPAMTDLLAGHVDIIALSLGASLPYAAKGVRILAVADDHRSDLAPEIPTLAEAGVQGMPPVVVRTLLLAPKGTAEQIVEKLNAESNLISSDAKSIEFFRKMGWELGRYKRADVIRILQKEAEFWSRTLNEPNFKMQ